MATTGQLFPEEEKWARRESGAVDGNPPSTIFHPPQEELSHRRDAPQLATAESAGGSGETKTSSMSHISGSSGCSPRPRTKEVLHVRITPPSSVPDSHHTRVTPPRSGLKPLTDSAKASDPEVIPFPAFTVPVEPPEAFKEAAQLCIRQQQHKQVGSASAVARQHNLQGLEECLTVKKAEALIEASAISYTLLTHFAAETFVVAMSYERCAAHMFHKRRMSSSAASSQHLPTSDTFSNLDLRELANFGERIHTEPVNVVSAEQRHQTATTSSNDSPSAIVLELPQHTVRALSAAVSPAGSESGDESGGPGRNPITLGADIPDILLRFTDKYHFDHIPTEDIPKALRARSHEEQTSMLVDLLSAVRGVVLQRHHILSANTSSAQMSLGSPAVGLHAMPSMKTLPVPQLVHDLEVGEDDAGFPTVNEYTIIGEAGKGSYGSVKIALNATGDQRAIKVMPKGKLRKKWADAIRHQNKGSSEDTGSPKNAPPSPVPTDELSKLHHEIAVMKKIRHQNIVPLLEVIDDPNEDVLYLVMPYIERGPLLRMTPQGTCAPLDIDVAKGYMRQLLDAMQYLHERHIIHRDIKPDNILLGNDGRVYLSDFGVSQMFKEDEEECVDAFGGTPAFMAPECFVASGHAAILGKPVDVWALGVTFYSMVLGHLPFEGHSVLEMGTAIKTEELQLPPLESFPADRQPDYQLAFDLLHEMLQKDPKLRFSVRQCRFHPFVCRMKSRVDILRHHPKTKNRGSLSPQRRGGSPILSQPPTLQSSSPDTQSRPPRTATAVPVRGPSELPLPLSSSIPPLVGFLPPTSVVIHSHTVHRDDTPLMAASSTCVISEAPTTGSSSDDELLSVPRDDGDDDALLASASYIAVEVTDEERENAFTYCFQNDTTGRAPPQASQWSRQSLKSTTAGSPLLRNVLPRDRLPSGIKRQEETAGSLPTLPWGKPSFEDGAQQ